MAHGLRMPRALPATITAMALLLTVKSVWLVGYALDALAVASPTMMVAQARAADPEPKPSAQVLAAPATGTMMGGGPAGESKSGDAEPVDDGERAVLLDLRHRRDALDAREQQDAARETMLTAAEHRLAQRVAELQALQTRLETLEGERRARDEANWRGLVKLYESMRPREAAAIFDDLDMPVLLSVVDRMREGKAAAVLSAMQPEKVRQVTAQLAELRTRLVTPAPAASPAPGG